ncbi:voltage-gated potassium channel [Butyrivibrio sp. INlla18]|uniref:ion transporter n=1 Tax=Butyrivibrio sp. INlla18 TaxID=1520806 RepID=UPI000886F9A9|nr:ion transporter [Butyrivibrio sp. INlla18]SDA60745.1 voltage-gated potassium channel [Butyrivibrio sp. INlla18]
MRKRIFGIIETSEENDKISSIYDAVMLLAIIISIVPLAFKKSFAIFQYTDIVTTVLFIVDYVLRLITADYKLKDHSAISFVKYPFTPWAIIDLVSILPTISAINSGFKLFRLFRIFRTFRVFRVFKAFRYSKSITIIAKVINNSKEALLAVCTLAIGYILVSALVIFSVEGDSFNSFFDAVYWATVSLTTVGYGDIYPVTTAGRVITMISSMFGIAVVALPAGIITARYLEALTEEKNNKANNTNP